MRLLRDIKEKDVGVRCSEGRCVKKRFAARAVLFNDGGKVAVLSVLKKGLHKIPGGGVEKDEDIIEALKREVFEESGQKIRIIKEVGYITEKRNKIKTLQTSYCYICKVLGKGTQPKFTDSEKNDGYKLGWFSLDKAIDLLKKDKPKDYWSKFMRERDLTFLIETKKMLENKP